MKIGITTFGADGGRSGIGQYVVQVLRALTAGQKAHDCEVWVHPDECEVFLPEGMSARLVGDGWRHPVLNVAWHQGILPARCRQSKYDVLFLPAGNRRVPFATPCPAVGTVHDFSSLHVQDKYDPVRLFYIRRVLPGLVRRLSRVITISQSSKRDIVTFAGVPEDRVDVIPLGVDHGLFCPQDAATPRPDFQNIRPPYLLYVSRIEHPGKNHVRLIRAFAHLKSQGLPHQLVLAGGDCERAEDVHAAAEASGWASDIVFTGFFPGRDLPRLYRGADAVVFPSLYEGFGLPVLEAMACGVPVACSNTSSLPEVAGDAAVLFDAFDVGAIAAAVSRLVTDSDLRAQCVDRGLKRCRRYTWSATAVQTLRVLERAAEEGR